MSTSLPEPVHAPVWPRAGLLAALLCVIVAVAVSDNVHEVLISALTAGRVLIADNPTLGIVVFVLLSALSAMLAFVSVAIVVPVAVFAWGETLTMLLLWVGWIIGGLTTYCAGRYLGRPLLSWSGNEARLQKFEHAVHRNASFSLVVVLQLAIPSEIPGYLLGASRYSLRYYLLALALAELPYAVGTTLLGAGLVEGRASVLLASGAGVIVLSALALHVLRRRTARTHASVY